MFRAFLVILDSPAQQWFQNDSFFMKLIWIFEWLFCLTFLITKKVYLKTETVQDDICLDSLAQWQLFFCCEKYIHHLFTAENRETFKSYDIKVDWAV